MQALKEQLTEAARDVLLQEGLTGFSMRRVAQACRVSATAIYRHFPDKDALLASAIGEAFGLFGSYLTEALSATKPLSRLRRMGHQYFAFAKDHERYYQLIFMTNCSDLGFDQLDSVTRERAAGTFQMLVDRIEDCQRAGVVKRGDSRAQAAFVWASYHGLASLHLTGMLGVDAEAFSALEEAHVEGVLTALSKGSFWADTRALSQVTG